MPRASQRKLRAAAVAVREHPTFGNAVRSGVTTIDDVRVTLKELQREGRAGITYPTTEATLARLHEMILEL